LRSNKYPQNEKDQIKDQIKRKHFVFRITKNTYLTQCFINTGPSKTTKDRYTLQEEFPLSTKGFGGSDEISTSVGNGGLFLLESDAKF